MSRIAILQNLDQDFLSDDDGICNDSLYFATVLLATSIPSSFNKAAIALSDKGLRGFSLETNF